MDASCFRMDKETLQLITYISLKPELRHLRQFGGTALCDGILSAKCTGPVLRG